LNANAQYVGAKQEPPEKQKPTESRILISYGNNETDNTNGANLVIDYSEGDNTCASSYQNDKGEYDTKTYSYYLKPVCALSSTHQYKDYNQ
jgi:hypothetical protein